MAIELHFEKSNETNWGFRLTGGADFHLPITVVKVTENSVAELGGLRTNDIIVRVNDIPTAGLTHTQVHDVLLSSGNELTLALYRDLSGNISSDELNDDEVSLIMQRYSDYEEVNPDTSPEVNVEKSVSFEEKCEELNEQNHNENHVEQNGVQTSETHQQNGHAQEEERKWSTFLQKPKNPKPILKKTDQTPQSAPYRVVIKKQPKKSEANKKNVEIKEDENVEEHESRDEEIEQEETVEENVEETEEENPRSEEEPEEETTGDEKCEEDAVEVLEKKSIHKTASDLTQRLLEEKLAEVQKQLEALSLLPSTIQSTIDAVTKQLASIVNAKTASEQHDEEAEENINSEDNDYTERVFTDDENLSENEEIIELEEDSVLETIEEEHERAVSTEPREETEENQEERENHEEKDEDAEEADPEEGLTEEEKEVRRLERELIDKQQKELEVLKRQRAETKPLKPIERPIILPGGRRWSQPDDACPTVRNPKMTDEKIANTIETYSEVIVGKSKGESNCFMVPSRAALTKRINFLKYQPPPKNLDYLQKSEVYRLVHDMEPPVRGICSRACKILAEQDYYQKNEMS